MTMLLPIISISSFAFSSFFFFRSCFFFSARSGANSSARPHRRPSLAERRNSPVLSQLLMPSTPPAATEDLRPDVSSLQERDALFEAGIRVFSVPAERRVRRLSSTASCESPLGRTESPAAGSAWLQDELRLLEAELADASLADPGFHRAASS